MKGIISLIAYSANSKVIVKKNININEEEIEDLEFGDSIKFGTLENFKIDSRNNHIICTFTESTGNKTSKDVPCQYPIKKAILVLSNTSVKNKGNYVFEDCLTLFINTEDSPESVEIIIGDKKSKSITKTLKKFKFIC